MIRGRGLDDLCALCDEFSRKLAEPDQVEQGRGLCPVAEPGKPLRHVDWDGDTCVSFRLDRPNLRRRRQFVEVQRRAQQAPTTTAPE